MLESKAISPNKPWDIDPFRSSPDKLKPNPTPSFRLTYQDLSHHYQESYKDNSKQYSPSPSSKKSLYSHQSSQASPTPSKQAFNDEENIEFDITDDLKPIQNTFANDPNKNQEICCPFCQRKIELELDKLIQSLQIPSFNKLAGDFQLCEKIRMPFSPGKTNFVQGKRESKSLYDLNSENGWDSPVIKPQEVMEGSGISDMSGFLYELADQKAKFASALSKNDEILFELHKKQSELNLYKQILHEKDTSIEKLRSENLKLRKDSKKCRDIITQLNSSQKILMNSFNKFVKLQTSIKS